MQQLYNYQDIISKQPVYHLCKKNDIFLWNVYIQIVLQHVYMRPEVNSNRFEISNHFEMSFRLHGNLHEISLQQLSKQ